VKISNSNSPKKLIGVIGAGSCNQDICDLAYEVGRHIALHDGILVCGGLEGVMAAAAKGAREAGGLTVGILPGTSHESANPDIVIPIPTGLDHARNVLVVRASHGLIAVAGGYGTLSEIALALKMGKPVIGLQSWALEGHLDQAVSPETAVERLYQLWH
jgi:uncharacterized protein (TIGR00725 family)